jgi:protein-S-isoprenylcysteine O-methyltransferase Ste14
VARLVPRGLERSFYVWVASLLFLAVCLSWQPLTGVVWDVPVPARWLLYVVQLAGVVVTLRSASRIDIWELAGVRQARTAVSSTSAQPQPDTSPASPPPADGASTLEVGGAYRWVRHPIYFGWVLMVFGTPTMTASRLLFAGISTLYLVLAIPFEERSLTAEFGAAYTAYQRQVRWRLVPGIW